MSMGKAILGSTEPTAVFPRVRGDASVGIENRLGWPSPRAQAVDRLRSPRQRIGIIFNQRAHRNLEQTNALATVGSSCDWASPQNADQLHAALARFARAGVDHIVVDGGDGTIRDVITAAADHFIGTIPLLVLVPSGKTNALASDLGIPRHWTLDDAIATIPAGRVSWRSPLEIVRVGQPVPVLRGFLFGAGAFVKATALAQGVHRLGAFRSAAVAMSIVAAVAQTMFARHDNPWRMGERMCIDLHDGTATDRSLYLLLCSTLERMPLGLKPFGRVRAGLKLLGIEAPPRRIIRSLPALLGGAEAPRLREAGYHRCDAERATVTLDGQFILDGEAFHGGTLSLAAGAPLGFIVP